MGNHIWNERCENERRIRDLEKNVDGLREVLEDFSYVLGTLLHEAKERHTCNQDCATCDAYMQDTYDDAECCYCGHRCEAESVPSDVDVPFDTVKKAPTKVKIHKVRMCCH